MGTITAKSIIDKASTQLLDPTNVRWTRTELLGWVNDAQRQIVVLQPNATNKVSTIQLAAGTRQSIPSDGWTLLNVIRYMGTNGTTPGRALRVVSQQIMDAYDPNWHAANPSLVPKSYIFDQQDQTVFYVYPPNTGRGYVQVNYSPEPADLTNENQAIVVRDIFETAILDYVLYRANSKDAEYAPGLALASGYLQTFMATMGVKSETETKNSPNQHLQPRNPSTPGTES